MRRLKIPAGFEDVKVIDHVDSDPLINAPNVLLCEADDLLCKNRATFEFKEADEEGTYYTYRCGEHPADAPMIAHPV